MSEEQLWERFFVAGGNIHPVLRITLVIQVEEDLILHGNVAEGRNKM